jgi:hypothetical protein
MKVNVMLVRKKKKGVYVLLMKAINIVQWKLQKKENDKKIKLYIYKTCSFNINLTNQS